MRVGIAIPSYQGKRYIGSTLESLIAQTHTNWYCVVVNDGDEDGTADVVRTVADPRIRYSADGIRRGQLRAFNRAILEVLREDADIVRLLSADDVLYAHDLADSIRVFCEHPRVGLVSTHFDGIDGEGRLLFRVNMAGRGDRVMAGRDYLLKGVAVGNTVGGPSSVAIRRSALESAGLFDTRLDYAGDSDLWHRVAAGWDVGWVGGRAGFQYRFHSSSVTARDQYSPGKFADSIQVVRRVAATEPLFGRRWWVHQYTIGRLHAINLQVMVGMARRGHWQGVRAGLRASLREGLVVYAPFWMPRIPYQLLRGLLGLPVSRRLLWRGVHESLQPPRIPATDAARGIQSAESKSRSSGREASGNRL
jgi:glycosyltransferase involved in cell wall biosynthesis